MPVFRPGKPRTYRTRSADWTPGNGFLVLSLTTVVDDGAWGAAQSSSIIDVAIAGLYLATFSVKRGTAGGTVTPAAELEVNGAVVCAARLPATSGADVAVSGAWQGELAVGDQLQLRWNGSATTTVKAAGTHLAATRVGPVRWT